jgi:hypothetical protein
VGSRLATLADRPGYSAVAGHVDTLAADIAQACSTLADKGAVHEPERKRVKTGTGY